MAKLSRPNECDVRLQINDQAGAAGAACDVQPVPVIRHLSKGPDHTEAWCRTPIKSKPRVIHELVHAPIDCTCMPCLRERLDEIKRHARLSGQVIPGEEIEYHEEGDEPAPAPLEPVPLLPGSRDKQRVMRERHSRRQTLARRGDASLEQIDAGLAIETGRNGALKILGVLALRGKEAEERATADSIVNDREALTPSLLAVFSGEAFLGRLEQQIGRSLHQAARALAAWPWQPA